MNMITENKKIEDEVAEKEQRYSVFIQYSSEGIWAYDLEPPLPMDLPVEDQLDLLYERAYMSEANDTLARMLGYEKGEELLGMRLDNFQPRTNPDNVAYVENVVREKFNVTSYELTAFGFAGEIRTMLNNIVGIVEDGKLLRIWGISRDITDIKADEEKLKAMEHRYRTVADYTYDWEYWEQPDGSLEYVSPSCERITGYPPEEFIQDPNLLLEIILPEFRDEWLNSQQEMLFDKKPRQMEFQIKGKNGNNIWIEHVGQQIIDASGKYDGYRASNREITFRKEAEKELQESQKNLRDLAGKLLSAQENERRLLARELHDDLTQRLAVLAIDAGKLQMDPACTSDGGEALAAIQKNLVKISEDVHGISRQLHPSIIEDLGLEDALNSEISLFLSREDIPVQLSVVDLPQNMDLDTSICIFRVTQEALRNIGKYSAASQVSINLICENNSICLKIEDDGKGFDPKEVRKKPGIGLASMRERMRLVGGSLSIQSQPDQGCIIQAKIQLPDEGKGDTENRKGEVA